jgi:hypothetical protein
MPARSLEAKLATLRDAPSHDDVLAALRAQIGVLVAAALRHVETHGLVDEIAPAFARLCEQGVKRDPGCRGKVAIARWLHDNDRWDDAVFARGVTYQQREPAFGGPVDTAGELRGISGIAYAHAGASEALDVLAHLLADADPVTRIAAAQGLGDSRRDGSALLRYKALVGDAEPDVTAAVLESLLRLSGEAALDFVAGFLAAHDERAELAAYALGGSRLAAAFPLLVAWSAECATRQRHTVAFLALALLRDARANAVLVDAIATADRIEAVAAAKALATFAADPVMAAAIRDAAGAREARLRAEILRTIES